MLDFSFHWFFFIRRLFLRLFVLYVLYVVSGVNDRVIFCQTKITPRLSSLDGRFRPPDTARSPPRPGGIIVLPAASRPELLLSTTFARSRD